MVKALATIWGFLLNNLTHHKAQILKILFEDQKNAIVIEDNLSRLIEVFVTITKHVSFFYVLK